jgi:transposase
VLLTARKLLVGKALDMEMAIRGLLRNFGLKVGPISKGKFVGRVRELIAGQAMLEATIEPLLRARDVLRGEMIGLHKRLLSLVRDDAVCRRLMTVPGVGAVTAMTFKTAIDDPARFRSSKSVGAALGLTPRKYQSGETDRTGAITKAGDAMAREALYEAATSMLCKSKSMSVLKAWGMAVAKRRGFKRAGVALARKLATVLHRMWVSETEFRFSRNVVAAAA